jgi:hypothetical protein
MNEYTLVQIHNDELSRAVQHDRLVAEARHPRRATSRARSGERLSASTARLWRRIIGTNTSAQGGQHAPVAGW